MNMNLKEFRSDDKNLEFNDKLKQHRCNNGAGYACEHKVKPASMFLT